MPLPSNVIEYVARQKQSGGVQRFTTGNNPVSDITAELKSGYMRGYVGGDNRISGEAADSQIMEMINGW